MSQQPLAEIFGFPADNQTPKAERYRKNRLCAFNNRVANCTKDKANDPLGVCSVYNSSGEVAITCPIRFRQDWLIAEDAARFFFPPNATWTSLSEVRLNDRNGVSAGNIDLVLVSYDERGRLLDFGTLEIQAVYISGNVRRLFEMYMENPEQYASINWLRNPNRPRPDYLSSSRKRLVPQMIYKGSILKSWGKKQAVALHRGFFNSLPPLEAVQPEEADIAWLIYDLVLNPDENEFHLTLHHTAYTRFKPSLDRIITPEPGELDIFQMYLQEKLDTKLETGDNPPDAPTLADLL